MLRALRARPPVQDRRSERELFFWTAHEGVKLTREAFKLIFRITLTMYFVISMIRGTPLGYEELMQLLNKVNTLLN